MNKLYTFQETNINILGTHEKPLFFASQIAQILGYSNTQKAIYNHVWEENKTNVQEYNKKILPTQNGVIRNINHQTVLLNEPGVYQLIFSSKLEKAKIFQQWVFSEVLPTIRKTGAYQMPKLINNQMMILNETDLHKKVVDYLRK